MKLTENDRRTLEGIRDAIKLGGYDRWVPHLQRERVGARRLVAFGLVTNLGPCPCRDCDNPRHYGNDAPSSYVLTPKGKRVAARAKLRALREVAEAARAFYGHVTEHHRTCPCCDVDDSSLCEPTCRFNAIADALAKVPR